MDFLFKVAYYAAMVVSGLMIGGLFLANLFSTQTAGESWRHKVIACVAAGAGFGLLYVSFRLGHEQGQWLAGLGVVVAAVAAAAIVMFAGLMMFTTIRWT